MGAMGDPTRTNVVVAVMGASAGLGGFVLVFLGQLISAYQSYPADTPKSVRQRRSRAAWPVLVVFGVSIAAIAVAFAWLAIPGGTCLYRVVLAVFIVELAAIVGVAVHTALRLLR